MNKINYIESGRVAGCPFCIALENKHYRTGERIRLLRGSFAGKQGNIVDPPENFKNNADMLLVQLDEDAPDQQIMVNLGHDIVERLPSLPIPSWAPPLSIRKTSELHERLISFCKSNANKLITSMDTTSLYFFIWNIWHKRLPLEPMDIWYMLETHGIPLDWKNDILNISEHGLGILINALGKKPIKKNRVDPMTVTISKKHGFSE